MALCHILPVAEGLGENTYTDLVADYVHFFLLAIFSGSSGFSSKIMLGVDQVKLFLKTLSWFPSNLQALMFARFKTYWACMKLVADFSKLPAATPNKPLCYGHSWNAFW